MREAKQKRAADTDGPLAPAFIRRMEILVCPCPPHGLVESLAIALLQPYVGGRALPHAHDVAKFFVCPAPYFLWE